MNDHVILVSLVSLVSLAVYHDRLNTAEAHSKIYDAVRGDNSAYSLIIAHNNI